MENLKIRVANEAESKEAQELFFELGFIGGICTLIPYIYADSEQKQLWPYVLHPKNHKEITLPQLRDMVVLKRNDVNDATHGTDANMGNRRGYLTSDNVEYFWDYPNRKWNQLSRCTFKSEHMRPILEQQIAAHDILAQCEPKLFLDPTQNYAEIEWDGTFLKGDDWIEVPEWANYAYDSDPNICFLKDEVGFNHPLLLWQRTQDEPFLTPESLCGTIECKPDFSEQNERVLSDEQQRLLIQYPHYYKDVRHLAVVDVYEVLDLFDVTDQAVGHAVKKLLVTGKRGTKGRLQDLKEARDTLSRAIEIQERKANEIK